MKRKDALAHLRVAGYHEDKGAFVRLFTEARISYQVATDAYRAGLRAREAGVRCTCRDCNK